MFCVTLSIFFSHLCICHFFLSVSCVVLLKTAVLSMFLGCKEKVVCKEHCILSDLVLGDWCHFCPGSSFQLNFNFYHVTLFYHFLIILLFQQYMRDVQVFETWIESREAVVKDDEMGESIPEVEELIRRHDDFLKAIDAQADKLDPIKRITLVGTSATDLLSCGLNSLCANLRCYIRVM